MSSVIGVYTMDMQFDHTVNWDRDTLRNWNPTSAPEY